MITIAIHFPAGRYHATPWGSHVNEGLVEWPPNPWRLMRALIAVGFAKLQWDAIPEDARSLIEKLASALPHFHLPVGQLAHTRHYMPSGGFHNKQKNLEMTDKVLDTFVRLHPDKPLFVRWPVELTEAENDQLELLLNSVSYLGRAESWVDMGFANNSVPSDGWTQPSLGEPPTLCGDQVVLLVASEQAEYADWREESLQQSIKIEQQRRGKDLTKTQRAAVEDKFPSDLIGCLTMDTSVQQKHGWSQPPGSTRVLYNRVDTLAPLSQTRSPRRSSRSVEAALLSLSSDSVRGDRLPRMSRAVRQGEFIHQALVSIINKQMNVRDCSVLVGRTASGARLAAVHTHAHYFPLDLDDDERIDHVLIYASGGLDETARRAITRIRRTWTKGDDTTIFVTCSGFANLDLFRQQLRHNDGRPVAIIPAMPSTVWTSATPYVPARHLKPKNDRYTLADDIRRELDCRHLPTPISIEPFTKTEVVNSRFFQFARKRMEGKPQPPQPNIYGVRLHFPEPIFGPIAIGYGSHFGLGMFAAESVD